MALFEQTTTTSRQPWGPIAPYITGGLQNLQNLMNSGAYTGPFTAPINPTQTTGIAAGTANAGGAPALAGTVSGAGAGLTGGLNQAYQFYSNAVSGQPQNPLVTNPNPYLNLATMAANNPYMDASITAALRDPYRGLTEQTLPGIAMDAQAAGNAPSRRNMLEAIARRGYEDRAADVAAAMRGAAWDTGLGMAGDAARMDQTGALSAASNLGNLGSTGIDLLTRGYGIGQTGAADLAGWGDRLQGLDQAQLEGAIRGHYEPWKLMDAYGQYTTPLATGLASESSNQDMGTMGPLINIMAQLLAARMVGGGSGGGSGGGIIGDIFGDNGIGGAVGDAWDWLRGIFGGSGSSGGTQAGSSTPADGGSIFDDIGWG